MNHPSIITVGTTPAPVRTYPSGFVALDEAAGDGGALQSGRIFAVVGDHRTGRTASLLAMVPEVIGSRLRRGEVICVAAVTQDASRVLDRLSALGVSDSELRTYVRVASTATASELALFVAQVASEGEKPAVLLVDDLGAITGATGGHDARPRSVLEYLSRGNVAAAVEVATGSTFGVFGLGAFGAFCAPIAIGVTVRLRGTDRAMSVLDGAPSVIVDTDGCVYKSRYVGSRDNLDASAYFVDVDGGGDATLWLRTDGNPKALLRKCDLPHEARCLWPRIVSTMTRPDVTA